MRKGFKKLVFLLLVFLCVSVCLSPNGTALVASASSAGSMVVLESSTQRILYQKNAYDKRYMASTTKIVTAITVIENTKPEEMVTVDKAAVGVEGSSVYLQAGEQMAVVDLLYGLMHRSGNDAAVALALHTAGSVENFAQLMNDTAKKIGAHSSHFVNPHGLHSPEHYTTAYDLALIASFALKNPLFATIVGSKSHTFLREGVTHTFYNKNKILSTTEGGDGVKTGFTKKAGRCLVSSATRGGMQVVCVVLHCGPMFEESKALLNKAFAEYTLQEILPSYACVGQAKVRGGKGDTIRVFSKTPVYYPLRKEEHTEVTRVLQAPNDLSAPIKKHQEVGKIAVFIHNRLLSEQPLYSIDSVKSLQMRDMLKDLLEDWF